MSLPSFGDLTVRTLGERTVSSPFGLVGPNAGGNSAWRVSETARVLVGRTLDDLAPSLVEGEEPASFERAGARERIYFEPAAVTAGIVSCGGLCPGINDVVRAIVLALQHGYGVRSILGFRYGFAGVAGDTEVGPPLALDPAFVETIHKRGGSVLGTSRGPQPIGVMLDNLERHGVDMLFTIGGDGTLRGAAALAQEATRRGLDLAVVGVPKTIDNDIRWIERSFGFATAVEKAREAIVGAHAEARGAWNGVGLVKLMGRHSGFIAAHAALASGDVNFCLVPEVPFRLDGDGGLLDAVERRLRERHHAVVVVAEGAGQEWMETGGGQDASGNTKLGDIGPFLKAKLRDDLGRRGISHSVKYIDPSYLVRSMPAGALDSEYCLSLGQHAAHAALSGRTGVVVGSWNGHFTHVPMALAVSERKSLDPAGDTWQRVLETTGQPASIFGFS